MAAKTRVKKEEKPIRLFTSDLLESFTHINPLVVLVVFLILIALFIYRAATINADITWWQILLGFIIGFVLWSPTEYLLHRFVFHWMPKVMTPAKERFLFMMHGIHHAQPMVKTRLVMPPIVSLPLAIVFYFLFWLIIGKLFGAVQFVDSVMAGFLFGYLTYDMMHYSLHHINFPGGYYKKLRVHHMNHHFLTHDQRFGVSSWFWDRVFGTLPKDQPKKPATASN